MLAEHPHHPLHWFEPAAHGPLSPRLQKGSCPKHRFVVPEVIKAFLEIPRPACGHLARQQTRAWDLKECFDHFWNYKTVLWAGAFLESWTKRAMRSRLEPMKRVARMLRKHEGLILNWFEAKGEVSSGAVEGLNNKIRVVTRRSYGFRTYKAMELALYHTLGRLPEPESTHRFC